MKRRSGAACSADRAADPRAAGGEGGGSGGLTEGGPPSAAATAAVDMPPPPVAPRCPALALFRWEERAGPSDVWDSLPFPPGGPGVLGRLLSAAAGSNLFRERRGEGCVFTPTLSANINVDAALQLLPLMSDEDVEMAVQLWQMGPGGAGSVIGIVVREEGLPVPPSFLRSGRGLLPPRPPPALANALPFDVWACIFSAIASSRCVGGANVFTFFCSCPPSPPFAPP